MGNRAVITVQPHEKKYEDQVGVYLHWNGGRDSIEGFLKYCKLQGFRSPSDDSYGTARLAQVIANFFGSDGLSVGVDVCKRLDCDNYDNGVYFIERWEIVGRDFHEGKEQSGYDLLEILIGIDESQPVKMQLGKEKIETLLAKEKEVASE